MCQEYAFVRRTVVVDDELLDELRRSLGTMELDLNSEKLARQRDED